MARPKFKKIEIKKLIRITNVSFMLLTLAVLGLSGLFLSTALNEDATTAGQDPGPAIETLNLGLLEQVRGNLEKKKMGGDPLPTTIRNPFVRTMSATAPVPPAPEPPPPPPAPPPEPTPPPAT